MSQVIHAPGLARSLIRRAIWQHNNHHSRPTFAHRRGRVRELRRGALIFPDVGEVEALKRLLYQATTDLTLKLFRTNVTPSEGDTHASYTVANFTNYVNKTLTASQSGGTWAVPTTSSGTSSTNYAQQSWTCGATGNTIYGYWIETSTPTLFLAELFGTARTLADTDVLNLTPRIEAA